MTTAFHRPRPAHTVARTMNMQTYERGGVRGHETIQNHAQTAQSHSHTRLQYTRRSTFSALCCCVRCGEAIKPTLNCVCVGGGGGWRMKMGALEMWWCAAPPQDAAFGEYSRSAGPGHTCGRSSAGGYAYGGRLWGFDDQQWVTAKVDGSMCRLADWGLWAQFRVPADWGMPPST